MPTVQHDENTLTVRFEDLDELAQHAPSLAEGPDPAVRLIFRGLLDSLAAEGVTDERGPVTVVATTFDDGPDADERWRVSWEVED